MNPQLDQCHLRFEQIEFSAVSPTGFSDVSILTMGEADGHGMIVDEQTIDDFMKLSLGKTIPAYLTHTGATNEEGKPQDRLGKEIGMFSGFYRDGNRVRAKTFQFLKAFIDSDKKTHATLVEMASKFADKLGISPVIAYLKTWVMPGGKEMVASDGIAPPGALNVLPAMRIRGIKSCDFVQEPAANIGLFEAQIDESANSNLPNMDTITLAKHNEALDAEKAKIVALSTQHKDAVAALEKKLKDETAALQAKLDEAVAQKTKFEQEQTQLKSALAAKTQEAEEAAKYDMRKAGAPALQVALEQHIHPIPAPKATDWEKWQQYVELGAKDPEAAQMFKDKYLTRKAK